MLGGALVVVGVLATGGVVVDRSVKKLPETSGIQEVDGGGAVAASGGQGGSQTTNSDSPSKDEGVIEAVLSSISRVLGLSDGSDQVASQQVAGGSGAGSIAQQQATIDTPQTNDGQTNTIDYRTWKIFGTSISGLEFSGLFQANSQRSYAYYKGKNFNTVRIPFDWYELQPDLYGEFDSMSKDYLDENIKWAKENKLSVILDAHNYGRRYAYRDGGFSDDFTSDQQHTLQVPYGDQDRTNGTFTFRDYGRGLAGTFTNPVSPAGGYRMSVDAKIDSYEGSVWNEFYIDAFYANDNNRYSLVINPVANNWSLRQSINGVTTILASGNKAWTVGQYYSILFDVNQAAAGKINISVDGTPLFTVGSVSSNPELTRGKVGFYPSGVRATIKDLVLNVAGDTTSGGPIECRLTETSLPIAAWKDFWNRMAKAYKDDAAILGYDHNEPHDMPVPTTNSNYSAAVALKNKVPVATATEIGQAMVDALRAAGDTKFVMVELDHWANTHYFTNQYGANPDPWIIDAVSPSKVVYSAHYYFDSDHSGFYPESSHAPTDSWIDNDVKPFFEWCQNRKVVCYEGEFGVPNTSEWQPALRHFLDLMKQYNIWWTQWAGGDMYASQTTLQPTNSFTTDRLQMDTIDKFLSQ